jgi:ABC-type amino acid transport substrate-binding protein
MRGKIRGDSTFFVQGSHRLRGGRPDGFALAAALLALLLISALVTAVFFAATEETRIGAASAGRQLALSAAESAVEMTIAGWNPDWAPPMGVSGTRTTAIEGFEVPVAVHVTRLDSTLYWIVAVAADSSSGSGASRRIGLVVRVLVGPDHSITIDRISERSWSELF